MDNPKLKIETKKYTGETTVISMRIPKDMLQSIDIVASKTGWTRNELITKCLDFSLENIEIFGDDLK